MDCVQVQFINSRLVPIFIGALLLGTVQKPFIKSKLKIDIKWNIGLLLACLEMLVSAQPKLIDIWLLDQ